jgi:hypothetical protein
LQGGGAGADVLHIQASDALTVTGLAVDRLVRSLDRA